MFSPRCLIGLALLVAATGSASADESALPAYVEAQYRDAAALAVMAGTCSSLLSPADNQRIHPLVKGEMFWLRPEHETMRPRMAAGMTDLYLHGVGSAEAKTVTPAICQKLLNEDLAAWNKTANALMSANAQR